MGDFAKHFSISPVLLVVNHVENEAQALENTEIAFQEGADGMFMINHSISPGPLRDIYLAVRAKYDQAWIGLNFLGSTFPRIFKGLLPMSASGLWTDNTGYHSGDPSMVSAISQLRRSADAMDMLYFGGVSFKGQHDTDDIPAACLAARECAIAGVDVITTSGTETGTPPSLEKVIAMRSALRTHPLALASGLTPDNVQPFLPHVNAILCSTGVSRDFTHFDPTRLRAMAKAVHGA